MLSGSNKKLNIKLIFVSLFSLLFFLLFSCKIVTFQQLKIKMSVGENDNSYSKEDILITLNYPPSKNSFEGIVRMQEKKVNVELTFDWLNDKTLSVKPKKGWKAGRTYSLQIQGKVLTKDFGDFDVNEKRYFCYGSEEDQLELLEYPTGTLTSDVKQLEFKFNKPLLQSSVLEEFSLSPFFPNDMNFSEDGKTLIVTPKDDWKINTLIKWKFTEDVKALDGFFIDKAYEGVLNTIDDRELPVLLSVSPALKISDSKYVPMKSELTEIRDDQAIAFTFSKAMNIDTIENNILFTPNIIGHFMPADDTNKIFIFQPLTNYDIGMQYHILIKDSIEDLNKLQLYESVDKFFVCANKFLEVKQLKMNKTVVINDGKPNSTGDVVKIGATKFGAPEIEKPQPGGAFDLKQLVGTWEYGNSISTIYIVEDGSSGTYVVKDKDGKEIKKVISLDGSTGNVKVTIEGENTPKDIVLNPDGTILFDNKLFKRFSSDDVYQIKIDIIFSSDIKDKKSAENSISCTPIFPSYLTTPEKVKITWGEQGSGENTSSNVLSITYKGFNASLSQEHYYNFTIKGKSNGVVTSNNDYMEEDVCVDFTVEPYAALGL